MGSKPCISLAEVPSGRGQFKASRNCRRSFSETTLRGQLFEDSHGQTSRTAWSLRSVRRPIPLRTAPCAKQRCENTAIYR